jgi:murein DD-endopeptidase MepM/ murein hydrolase activator NlpD
VEASFKKLLAALESDSALAEKIPVLHPMKNGPAVKKRFEIVYDPFTDSELPHRGIDYVAAEGDTVYATGAGSVIEVRKHRGFGLSVKVDHGHDVRTFYAHLGKTLVNQGQTVHRGQPIALIGESGTQSSLGLHYEIRIDGISINPESFYLTR